MPTDSLLHLTKECHHALELLAQAITKYTPDCVSKISECHRKSSSTLADLHAGLFSAFLPPLPRSHSAALGEAIYAVTDAIFRAALLLPLHAGNDSRAGELEALLGMSRRLCDTAATLPRYVKGKPPAPPDTYRFYAEQNKARASHALTVRHAERTLTERALDESLCVVAARLGEAHRALICLMLESV